MQRQKIKVNRFVFMVYSTIASGLLSNLTVCRTRGGTTATEPSATFGLVPTPTITNTLVSVESIKIASIPALNVTATHWHSSKLMTTVSYTIILVSDSFK